MARSEYIYIVRDPDGRIVVAFTVKHNLASWLRHRDDRAWLIITRHRDSHDYDSYPGVVMSHADILA